MNLKQKLGYACINVELQSKKIKTSRTIRKDKFLQDNNLELVSELSIQNLKDLRQVVRWNVENNINFYRITSNLFPWWSEYELESLPNFRIIKSILEDIGKISKDNNQRLTFHPGHFTILASNNPEVVRLSILELEQHSNVFDLMGFEPSTWNKLNIHMGTSKDGFELTANRFIENFLKLSSNCQKRITLENDDKVNMWSVKNLYDYIYSKVNIPIVFDLHHHRVGAKSDLSIKESMDLAFKTWGDIDPIIHFSSSKKEFEDKSSKPVAHADFVYESLNNYYSPNVWVMIEAKMKEQSLLEYRKSF